MRGRSISSGRRSTTCDSAALTSGPSGRRVSSSSSTSRSLDSSSWGTIRARPQRRIGRRPNSLQECLYTARRHRRQRSQRPITPEAFPLDPGAALATERRQSGPESGEVQVLLHGSRRESRHTAGFTGSVDYWNIKLDKAVGVIPANVILSNCLASGDPAYRSQIVRQPNTFSLTGNAVATGGYIIQQNFNIGTGEVSGIDVQTSYRFNLLLGVLRLALNGSYLLKNATQPLPGAHTYDCAGLFGSTRQMINPAGATSSASPARRRSTSTSV